MPRQFWTFFWSKIDSNYLDEKLEVFKNDDKEFRLVQNPTMGEAYFKQFMRLRNQLVIAAENFARQETLSPQLIPTMSKDMEEHSKLVQKLNNVVDPANRKICGILLRYNVDKAESFFVQVRLFARTSEDENFQQIVYVNYVHLLDEMKLVYY